MKKLFFFSPSIFFLFNLKEKIIEYEIINKLKWFVFYAILDNREKMESGTSLVRGALCGIPENGVVKARENEKVLNSAEVTKCRKK